MDGGSDALWAGGTVDQRGEHTRFHAPAGPEPPEMDGFPLWLAATYRREGRLGQGGMGVVYRYRDTKLDRPVAVKSMPATRRSAIHREQFLREAKVVASLDHPNIAKIHHVVEHENADYLILEYVPGEMLATMIFDGGLTVARALSICLQVGRAIGAGHEHDIVHRDIKPANIMVTPEGVVRLLDYGLAAYRPVAADEAVDGAPASAPTIPLVTHLGVKAMGTPGYMSPEQVRGEPVDLRTDLWAFGCVLYECLAGRPAFPGQTPDERKAATLRAAPDLGALPADAPDTVREAIAACLRPAPADRPKSIRDVNRVLRRALPERPSEEGPRGPRHNLPTQLTNYIQREGEIEALRTLASTARLLTLLGPGGAGKTRLACELAGDVVSRPGPDTRAYEDGVWFVELAPLADAERLPEAVASAVLAAKRPDPAPGQSVEAMLTAHLRDSRALLVLDNCEHVAGRCGRFVGDLLRHCPAMHVVVTSRQTLGVPGEQVHAVRELSFPAEAASAGEARQFESVRLFEDRASLTRPGFELTDANTGSVGAICRKLEGHPMAIELAAARVAALPIEMIAAHLFEVLDPTQVLESSIAWSIKLLSEPERTLLGRLAVFRGGWTLESAEAICGDEDGKIDGRPVILLLARLVEQSLVRYVVQADRARYRLLETVWQHARQHLLAGDELERAGGRHLEHFLAMAIEADEHFSAHDQAAWLDRLELEHDNIRAALELALAEHVDAATAVEFATALHMFWTLRGYASEGRAFIERAIDRRRGTSDLAQLRVCNAAGIIAWHQHDHEAAERHYEQALAIAREIDDRPRMAGILSNLGLLTQDQDDLDGSLRRHEASLAIYEDLGNREGAAMARLNMGHVLRAMGRFDEAESDLQRCLPVLEEAGDAQRVAAAQHKLGEILCERRAYREAERLLARSLEIRRRLRDKQRVARTVLWIAVASVGRRQYLRAARLLAVSDRLLVDIGDALSAQDAEAFERCVRAIRENLDDETRSHASEMGTGLTFEQAAVYALRDELPAAVNRSESEST